MDDDRDRASLAKWANTCERERALQAMLNLARICPGMSLLIKEFDADGWLLNVLNGEINLKTGEFRRHNPDSLCSKLAPVKYDPQATCEKWLYF